MFSKVASPALARSINATSKANFSLLRKKMDEVVPKKVAEFKEFRAKYADREFGKITLDQVIGGMRGMTGLFYDTSKLDANEGITFRGYSIPEIQAKLPKANGNSEEPLPEGVYWLLLTGEIPNQREVDDLENELRARAELSPEVVNFVKNIPKDIHPMTQLSMALLFLQRESQFYKAYHGGVHKAKYWESVYEDSINLIARIPRLAALIYRNKYKNGELIPANPKLDWAGNYAHMLGFDDHGARECFRGYLAIHSDHEGGNVSAHTCHLVGSALSDPYLSYSAALNGLAGPLHGLANQEVVGFLLNLRKEVGDTPSDQQLSDYVWKILKSGRVVPGFGHAVLRQPDPRFTHLSNFAKRHIQNDAFVKLVNQCFRVIPGILQQTGKVKNPWPNVDAHSGVLLYYYGMTEFDYYTVVFGVSRALGCLPAMVWSRAYGLPIERPGSVTMDFLKAKFEAQDKQAK